MSEKSQIERATATKFLELYNRTNGSNFCIIEHADSPDFSCDDTESGDQLALEVTLLEDLCGDIAYILGRGVRQGTRRFNRDTLDQFKQRISDKCNKDYGPNAALVLRQASILWSKVDWEMFGDDFRNLIPQECNKTYPMGIWVLTWHDDLVRTKHELVRLL